MDTDNNQKHFSYNDRLRYPHSFIDGSCNPFTGVSGLRRFYNDISRRKIEILGIIDCSEANKMRSVAGEILGAKKVIEKALELSLSEIDIYYDYYGVKK